MDEPEAKEGIQQETRVCRHWVKFSGFCMFGAKCRFLHPEEYIAHKDSDTSESSNEVNTGSLCDQRRRIFPRLKQENDQKRKDAPSHKINNKLLNRNKAGAFRRWLIDVFGKELLASGSGVIEVAGGKGALSFELVNLNDFNSTMVDPRPMNLRHFMKRLKVGLYHRTDVLQSYNDRLAPKEDEDVRIPKHIRIFFDDLLLSHLTPHQTTTDIDNATNIQFFEEALERGQSVCWSKKGLVDNDEVSEDMKYDQPVSKDNNPSSIKASNSITSSDNNDNSKQNDIQQESLTVGPTDEYLEAEDGEPEYGYEVNEIGSWEDAQDILTRSSIVVGLHPDQATEAIVDFALKCNILTQYRRKPFAVVPCCVYHKEFPHRKLPDGRPITKYEDFVNYLQAKDPQNIRITELDIEGKNKVVYWQPQ